MMGNICGELFTNYSNVFIVFYFVENESFIQYETDSKTISFFTIFLYIFYQI